MKILHKVFGDVLQFILDVRAGKEVDVRDYAQLFSEALEHMETLFHAMSPEFHVLFRDGIVLDEYDRWLVPAWGEDETYVVTLKECSCPAGQSGKLCRHRRALKLLEQAVPLPSSGKQVPSFSVGTALLRLVEDAVGVWELVSWSGMVINRFPLPADVERKLLLRWREYQRIEPYDPFGDEAGAGDAEVADAVGGSSG